MSLHANALFENLYLVIFDINFIDRITLANPYIALLITNN